MRNKRNKPGFFTSFAILLGLLLLMLGLTFVSCEEQHRHLVLEDVPEVAVTVAIHWNGVPKNDIPTLGMRLNMFALNGLSYGMRDLRTDISTHELPIDRIYRALCYDYYGSQNIYFRNENNPELIEAYSAPMSRSSYDQIASLRAGNLEATVAEPGAFYVAREDSFKVSPLPGDTLHFYPHNILKTYTFTIDSVQDAQYISDTRGALTGMSASYFLSTGALSTTGSTILFYAQKNASENSVTGTFRTFGRIADAESNLFTLEIMTGNGLESYAWDVKERMIEAEDNGSYHITVNANITIQPPPTPEPGGGGGFNIGLGDWGEEKTVVIKM
jgi:hypothetical protein